MSKGSTHDEGVCTDWLSNPTPRDGQAGPSHLLMGDINPPLIAADPRVISKEDFWPPRSMVEITGESEQKKNPGGPPSPSQRWAERLHKLEARTVGSRLPLQLGGSPGKARQGEDETKGAQESGEP